MRKLIYILLLAFFPLSTFAQVVINGQVSDGDTNEGLPGVNIIVKGTTSGTTSDLDGNFLIEVPSNESVLVFSFVGYIPQEVLVGTRSVLEVALVPDVTALSEVVVIGYGVQKKALVTGANINKKGADIAELNTGTAMEALQGVTPGVTITRNNGAPGAGTRVNIRGIGTIGNSNPLYVVDGVQVGNIDYLNPSDIESVDILKDAASAAIYGSRAANGVVLVTTKKGVKGRKAQVSYDAFYGVQNIYKNLSPLNASEYMYIMDEGLTNDGQAPNNWEFILQNNSWLNDNYPGLGTELGNDIWTQLENGWEGTNWIDEMTMANAPMQNHAVSITGASEDVIYSLGLSYFDQRSMIGGDLNDAGFKRLTGRINTEMVLYKNSRHSILKIGENLTYTNTENRSVATGNIYWNDLHNGLVQNPLMPAYWDKSPDQHGFTPSLDGLANDQTNPLATMYYRSNYNWANGNTVVGNVYAELEPIQNLRIRSSFGVNSWFGHSRSWAPTYALGVLYANANDAAQQDMYQGIQHTWTNTASYDKSFGSHFLRVLIGNEMIKNQLNMNVGGRNANTIFGKPQFAYLNNVQKTNVNAIDTWGADWAAQGGGLASYFSRVSYNFKEKYMLDATLRYDGSSNFAPDNRWGFFPSVSAGWNFTDEDFMAGTNFITDGKLRASWGQNGNESIDNFIYSSNIAYINPGYFFGDTKPISGSTAIPANVPNPDVTWETSEQLNFGLDTYYFNSRLTLSLDWYNKTTKDWLVIAPILGTSGAGAPWINGGDIKNTGVEMVVSWNDNAGEVRYGATISGAHNKNEVTRIDNAEGIIPGPGHVLSQGTAYISRVEVGKPIGYFFGLQTDGLLQNQDEVDAYVGPEGLPYFENQRPGDVRFVDQNNDGVIDEADKVMLGDPNPDFELGIQLRVEYKGFYANTTLSGRFGMQVMKSYRSFADRFDQNYTTEIFGRWHGEGTSNRLPRLSSSSHTNTNLISDIYMHDADYVRINNLTFGYRFGQLLKSQNWINDAKVYVAVNNLFTFTGYDGMDPEVRFGHDAAWASGIDLGLYPLPRTVMFGVNLSF